MKKVFSYVLEGAKSCLNVLMGAMCFVKIYRDVAIFPDGEDGTREVYYFYSIYDRLMRGDLQFLVYIALALMTASIAISVVSCIVKDDRKLRMASHIIFAVSALFFLALLIYTMQIRLDY